MSGAWIDSTLLLSSVDPIAMPPRQAAPRSRGGRTEWSTGRYPPLDVGRPPHGSVRNSERDTLAKMQRSMRALLLVTDIGFVVYWILTLGHLMPPAWLFHGYGDPTVMSWNLSFMPLDLIVSATGFCSLALRRGCPHAARGLLLVSLAATSISGLQAIAFWTLQRDFEPGWWLPNLALLLWPLPYLAWLLWIPHENSRVRA